MSVQEEINRINNAVSNAYTSVSDKGGTVPASPNVANLAAAINTIPQPTVNDATLTIQKNGTTVATFTANDADDVTANIVVPTDTADLTNGAGFITRITSANITTALGYTPANNATLTSHTGNTSNPHSVTKSQVGLGKVDNKSSATIRGEITSANVTSALGYTPVNVTQSTMTDSDGNTWNTRVWDSGKKECWASFRISEAVNTAYMNMYFAPATHQWHYPTNFFSTYPNLQVTAYRYKANAVSVFCSNGADNTVTPNIYIGSVSSLSSSYTYYHIYAQTNSVNT